MTDPLPVTAAATFCATLADEWVRNGVRHVVVAPGSRSTPLALALAAQAACGDDLQVHVFHDERSASFAALGLGRATGVPAVLLCTSGTAAANFHPAVVEAHQDEVPLVVCTADRPPELRDVAAPQTIDQAALYGGAVRWFCDPGVPDDATRATWRSLASRAVVDASGPRPGPVHLNLPFRDPLVGSAASLPAAAADGGPWHRAFVGAPTLDDALLDDLVARLEQQRGVIVAGAGAGDPSAVHALADAVGWPVLADPRSGCRLPRAATVAAFDSVLRHAAFASAHTPSVVLRLGYAPASKVLAQWLASSPDSVHVQVHATPRWIDADHRIVRVVASPTELCRALAARVRGASGTPWLARWRHAEERAQAALAAGTATDLTEPAVARTLAAALPDGAALVVSSSMPVRDVEWYAAPRDGLTVHANRGANGIDGVVSTAVGIALADPARPVALLLGDLAFLHDANGLLALRSRAVNLTIVVVDNGGGGIFSFLPQRTALPPERFEQLFGTPAGTDPLDVARAHGLDACEITTLPDLRATLSSCKPGARVLVVRTDRDANVAAHDALNRAVTAAL